MIAVYSNNIFTDHVITQLALPTPVRLYHDIESFVNADGSIKIALVNHINQYCTPVDESQRIEWVTNGAKFAEEIQQVQKVSDLVFAFDNEFHQYHCDLLQQLSAHSLYWVIPVHINSDQNHSIFNTYQFDWTVGPYKDALASRLNQLRPFVPKPKLFDALLGWTRPHRDFVAQAVKANSNIEDKILLTYMNYVPKDFVSEFLWEPEIEYIQDTRNSAHLVSYFGCVLPLSRIIPLSIYSETAYSIVAETSADNRYTFPTEKIIKPMMARRLFVVFSSVNFLKNLRSLGFKTFDSIIDETYDSIEDDGQRWTAAFEQVKKLCKLDQSWVFDQIRSIVDHNYNVAMTTDWNSQTLQQIKKICNSFLA